MDKLFPIFYFYFTQKSFTVSWWCEWAAGRGVESVTKEKKISVAIENKIPIVQYLALLRFIDDFFFWRVGKIAKSDC